MNSIIREKAAELKQLLDQHRQGDTYDLPPSAIDEVRHREEELALMVAAATAERALSAKQLPAITPNSDTLGERITQCKSFKTFGSNVWPSPESFDIDFKTTFATGAGWAPQAIRTDRVELYPSRPLSVLDIIPTGETTQSAVVYMAENAWTNAAAETAEEGSYPAATFTLTETTAPVRKIAVHLPVTDEQLDDVPRARDYIDNRLTYSLRLRLDGQVLVGNGTAPNLLGFLNHGTVQSQAKGTDTVLDAIFKAMTKVRATGFAEPTAIVLHPNDWQEIRLTKTGTEQVYFWGPPAEAGLVTIFGLPVVATPAITEGTALVGAFAPHSELVYRRDVEVQVGYSTDDFIKGRKTLRADLRVAFAIYRPLAFCKVTGI